MTRPTNIHKGLERILTALEEGGKIYRSRSIETIRTSAKTGGETVTDVELEVNQLLFEILVREKEGWLSEETCDNEDRLACSRVWIVDPLDGTREYVAGVPEWCISIALLEQGRLVAAGILNPQTEDLIYGSTETGVAYRNRRGTHTEFRMLPREALVLASRSEVERGEWKRFGQSPFQTLPMGSVAYKLSLVAAGQADATWTLAPKNEWDVAAGVALLQFAGGYTGTTEGLPLTFNQKKTLFPGVFGCSRNGLERLAPFLKRISEGSEFRDCLPWGQSLAAIETGNSRAKAIGLSKHCRFPLSVPI